MALDRKKLIKVSVLVGAFIISVALFSAVYVWYKKKEKKALEKAKKDLESKWMGKKDVFGIGIILDKFIEILVGTEQAKKEIESTLDKGKWEGAEVKVLVGKQPTASDKADKDKPKELPKSSHTPDPKEEKAEKDK